MRWESILPIRSVIRFTKKMKELDLILLSHGGEEKAVEADEDQKLGNPLLLRRALDHGVKVIVAHCAGLDRTKTSTARIGRWWTISICFCD